MIGVAAHRLAAPTQLADGLQRQGGNVEVQQHPFVPVFAAALLGHIQGDAGGGLELAPLVIRAAHRQGGQAFDRALHRGTDRARIEGVGAQVGAVVDAGEDHVGPLLQQGKQGQLDAVAGGAAAGPGRDAIGKELVGPLRPQGALQGQAVARGGALLVGANHRDLVTSA